jgi:oligopeptide/dipeptide ABC transporter ATP-binding protein
LVVQNPKAALSPTTKLGDQLSNAYQAHVRCSRKEAQERAIEGLRQVGISDPARRARAYPHQLSIGMAQRVLIAMALLHDPKLLIADEPTSGLDVTIQAEVLDLMMSLVRERGAALWLITHDLGLVANYCERAAVMFAGKIVEQGAVAELFHDPSHPYTLGLLDSRLAEERPKSRFRIAGPPPDLVAPPVGCSFAYRCPWVEERCRIEPPSLEPVRVDHEVRCFVAQRAVSGRPAAT